MTTLDQLLDGPRVEDITRQAREVKFSRMLLTVIAAVFFGIGWILHKTFAVIWLAVAWVFVATREGWREAGRVSRGAG